MIQRKVGEVEGERGWAIWGRERCPPADATLMENSHGGSRKLGRGKSVCTVCMDEVRDGMGNGRIAWDPREGRAKNKHRIEGRSLMR